MKGQNNGIFLLIAIIVGVIILLVFLRRKLKILKLPNVFLITGAVKTGKSALSVHLGIKQYRKNVFKWWLGKGFYWLRYHTLNDYPLKPMLYSNIPLGTMHNRLTKEIIYRQVKIPKKSVVIIDEASLFADSQLIKDKNINNALTLFSKLFGHETYGGMLIYNSQAISDLHYAIKRACGRYIYIYESTKYPFITIAKVREMVYSDDTSVVNDVSQDLELSMRTMVYFNRVYKKYDAYCYSVLTDHLMIQVDYDYKFDKKDLKAREIVSFNPYFMSLGKKAGEKEDERNKA